MCQHRASFSIKWWCAESNGPGDGLSNEDIAHGPTSKDNKLAPATLAAACRFEAIDRIETPAMAENRSIK
jgi:hypothetical protein